MRISQLNTQRPLLVSWPLRKNCKLVNLTERWGRERCQPCTASFNGASCSAAFPLWLGCLLKSSSSASILLCPTLLCAPCCSWLPCPCVSFNFHPAFSCQLYVSNIHTPTGSNWLNQPLYNTVHPFEQSFEQATEQLKNQLSLVSCLSLPSQQWARIAEWHHTKHANLCRNPQKVMSMKSLPRSPQKTSKHFAQ